MLMVGLKYKLNQNQQIKQTNTSHDTKKTIQLYKDIMKYKNKISLNRANW